MHSHAQRVSSRILLAITPLLVGTLALSACNSAGSADSAGNFTTLANPPGTGSNIPPGGNNSRVQVGESCISNDPNKICLAMHFVTYQDSSGGAVASPGQAATIIQTMNQIWSQCSIGFQIENYEAVDPTRYGLAYGSQSQNQLNSIRQAFQEPRDELLGVTTGPWGTSVNAWTNMPGSGLYGAVMEASIVGYGGGIIYAHEFGHYLGLDHASSTSNLMSPIIYTTSTSLTTSQCQAAQQTVNSYWAAMLRH